MNKILLSLISLTIIIGCSKNISPVDSGLETQTFHFGNGSEPQGIDPHIVTGVPEHHLLIALCEGLTTSNPRGGSSMPGAAESWEIDFLFTKIFKHSEGNRGPKIMPLATL